MPRGRRAVESLARERASQLEPFYRRKALQLLGRERDDVAAFIANAAKKGDRAIQAALRAVDRAYTDKQGRFHLRWTESYTDLNIRTTTVAARDLAAATGFRFDVIPTEAIKAATRRADELADYIGKGSSQRVTETVRDVLKAQGGSRDVERALKQGAFGGPISNTRAERIARTEVHGAFNEGQMTTALDTDIFSEKEWLHSGNPRNPREWHADMDGERVAIDDVFSNGLQMPGERGAPPEEVINCGCTLLYHV